MNLDENVYPIVPNVNGGCKLLLLKVSVGGIVLQNLILDILYSSGTLNIKGNGEYTGQERSERALCKWPTLPTAPVLFTNISCCYYSCFM